MPVTVTFTSNGAPASGPDLPPIRSAICAPTPASLAKTTACGSHMGPHAALLMPAAISARTGAIESPPAPPPGLSLPSARMTGLCGAVRASANTSA
ncbi:MAG: hypothetical protein CFE36_13705 [Sphingomonadaceae bacterium PASS1]|nr:MAG: hypothetical protein CFE36_13705 [Sphingomonadaceae bacterium PASS1]